MCTECASRSIIAQLNPLSSPLMRWYGKLPSQNHQKPESTAPDDWQHRLLFIWCKQPVQTEVQVCLTIWYSCKHCTNSQSNGISSICPMWKVPLKAWDVTQSMLSPKLSGLVMMHWRYRSCESRSFTNVPMFPLPMWTSPGWIQWSGASSHSVNLGQPQPLLLRCQNLAKTATSGSNLSQIYYN